jgi:hypothetical protein
MNTQRGAALIIAVMGVCLMAALSASLAVMTGTEMRIAANYLDATQARHAAEAALEIGIQELAAQSDWPALLSGTALSTFTDGAPGGSRRLGDGSLLDLGMLTNQMTMVNPAWRLFAFGPLNQIEPAQDVRSRAYVVVWVRSDAAEEAGSLAVRAEAFAPAGTRRAVEAIMYKTEAGVVRMRSWREIR